MGTQLQFCKIKTVLEMGGDDGCKNNILNILNATELEEAWLG